MNMPYYFIGIVHPYSGHLDCYTKCYTHVTLENNTVKL